MYTIYVNLNSLNVSIQPPEHLGEEYRVQNK